MRKNIFFLILTFGLLLSSCHKESFIDYRIPIDNLKVVDLKFTGELPSELKGMTEYRVYLCNSEESLNIFSSEINDLIDEESVNFSTQSVLLVWSWVGKIKESEIDVCYWPHMEQYGIVMRVKEIENLDEDYMRLIIITLPKISTNKYITFSIS